MIVTKIELWKLLGNKVTFKHVILSFITENFQDTEVLRFSSEQNLSVSRADKLYL